MLENTFYYSIQIYFVFRLILPILSEYLYGLVEAAGLVIERDVANWIANQGGWVGQLGCYLGSQANTDPFFSWILITFKQITVVLSASL